MAHDRLEMRITETAADRMRERMLHGSDFPVHQDYAYPILGFSKISARLELRESRLRFLRSDGGAIRFDVSLRSEFSFGFPYPDRRTDLSCAVLIKPVLGRRPDGRLVVSGDFARAELRGLRVKSRARGAFVRFDTSGFDALGDVQLQEVARFALRAALKRMGRREGTIENAQLGRVLDAAGAEDCLFFEVDDGEVRIGAGGDGSRPEAVLAPLPDDGSAAIRLPEDVLARFLMERARDRPAFRGIGVQSVAVECRAGSITVRARVAPTVQVWPPEWSPRISAEMVCRVEGERIVLRLVHCEAGAMTRLGWMRQLLQRAIEARIGAPSWPAVLALPVPKTREEEWELGVARIVAEGRSVLVVLEAKL